MRVSALPCVIEISARRAPQAPCACSASLTACLAGRRPGLRILPMPMLYSSTAVPIEPIWPDISGVPIGMQRATCQAGSRTRTPYTVPCTPGVVRRASSTAVPTSCTSLSALASIRSRFETHSDSVYTPRAHGGWIDRFALGTSGAIQWYSRAAQVRMVLGAGAAVLGMHAHAHTHAHAHAHAHTRTHARTHARTHTHTHAHTRAHALASACPRDFVRV